MTLSLVAEPSLMRRDMTFMIAFDEILMRLIKMINHIKRLLTLALPFQRDTATDESVTKNLWLKQFFFKAI